MKNINKWLQVVLLVTGLLTVQKVNSQNISPRFFGQNAWMPDTIGKASACIDPPCVLGGKLHQNWGKIKDSKATTIRFGGIAADRNMPTNYQYIKMIDNIRANGMEPIIQVPYHKGRYTAQQAATIVQYVNVTMGRNVKYWVIGNEPDLDYGYTTAAQVAAYIKPFASAMKAVDPSILTIGPECAWFNEGIINGLTTPNGPSDVTGKDAAGRFYLDVISFHAYPFNGTQTRAQVVSNLSSAGSLNDKLAYLNGRINSCNSAHNRTGLQALRTAVTEANVNYKNDAGDNLNGVGVNSFVGGQFIAEMMGVGMKQNVDFMNIWSVVEGNNTSLNIGYIDPNTGNKKPAYYHFKMVAEYFSGAYAAGTTNLPNVKSFGCKNGVNTTVLIMNQELSANHNFSLRLNASAVGGNSPLKVNIDAGISVEFNGTIPAQSTMLLVFDNQGALVKKVEYTLGTHAIANLPPTVTTVTNTRITTSLQENEGENAEVVNLKGFRFNLFPNPASSKFTIELDRRNPEEKKFEIEIFDIMGRLIHTRTTTFLERKQEMDMTGNSLAEAVYIVKVHEADDRDNARAEKIILFK
jgi:hypothetical protein